MTVLASLKVYHLATELNTRIVDKTTPITPDKIVVLIILYPDIVSFSFGVETSNCCTFCDDTDVADKFITDWLFTDSLFDSIFYSSV